MCTAVWYENRFFGRTFDWMVSYGERVVIAPRNFVFEFRHLEKVESHYAIMGMGVVEDGYPLFYEAVNEAGLGMAGLNFPGWAMYHKVDDKKDNVAPFEFIPCILSTCKSVAEARIKLAKINILDEGFNDKFGTSPLHWILADCKECITVESVKEGLKVYENSVGVLTNSPDFKMQLFNLNSYMSLKSSMPLNSFGGDLELETYSYGMGALGLPGDWSSMSRFVRAAFVRCNSTDEGTDESKVNQFFHILESVSQIRGCSKDNDGKDEITIYISCYDLVKRVYYYTTYEDRKQYFICFDEIQLNSQQLILGI